MEQYRQTFQVLKEQFGRTPAGEFGPKALKAVRQRMIDRGWTRKMIKRTVAIGPKAQQILVAFAPPDPTGYYFSPRRAVCEEHARRAAARRTPRYPSHLARNAAKRVVDPKRPPAEAYTVTSYSKGVRRAVGKVNRRRERLAGADNFDRLKS